MIVYLDGRFLPAEQATVSIDDRGLLFGDGVFETALLHRGGFLRLRQHLDRFAASARTMQLPVPQLDRLEEVVHALARENALADGNVRITLTRGVRDPMLFVTVRPPDAAWAERAARGWSVVTAQTRRPSTAAVPAQLKALGRTYALLARHEAAAAGADDALLLTDQGHICEGPAWNVFWRAGDTLFTPDLDLGVLAGVTRGIVIDLARDQGLAVRQGAWPRAVLDQADEIFATMTSVGLVPIRSLDGRHLDPGAPTATALQPLYWARVRSEVASDPVRPA